MNFISTALTALFKPTPKLRLTVAIPGQEECQVTLNASELQQFQDLAEARGREMQEVMMKHAGDQVKLTSALEKINQRFDAFFLQILHL